MAAQITPFAISAPGFYGLNLSDSPVDMSPNFALEAYNCVIDKSGRIASRKGWEKANSASADLGSSNIECIGELIQNDGTATTLCAGNNKLFKLDSGALVMLTYGGGGVAPTISASNWKFCQLNGVAMFWQQSHDPLIYDPAISTTTYRRLSERGTSSGTIYQCNEAISAYGRVWAAHISTDKQTLVWSDVLVPEHWSGGSSGSLDTRRVWPMGGDEITALAAHNNFLFIFGRRQILIYTGADNPSAMSLHDSITGIGCIARDSVQNLGDDVLFLSDMGVVSLMRTISEKSAPIRQVSKAVYNELQTDVSNNIGTIKSGYSPINQFYLLTMPTSRRVYCFDTRSPLQDGSARVTIWPMTTPTAFYETKSRIFYMGKPGYLGEYSGYLDDTATYRMTYFSTWIDFGNPIQTSILKKMKMVVVGGTNQNVVMKWAYDFAQTYKSQTTAIANRQTVAEYGVAEYNVDEYTLGVVVDTIQANGSSSGKVIQFGFETDINGYGISVQKVELWTKEGRI